MSEDIFLGACLIFYFQSYYCSLVPCPYSASGLFQRDNIMLVYTQYSVIMRAHIVDGKYSLPG